MTRRNGPLAAGAAALALVAAATVALGAAGPRDSERALVVSGGIPARVPVAALPVAAPARPGPATATATPQDAYQGWARQVSSPTGVPARALQAYAAAAAEVDLEQPSCGLTWVTLAGIGRIESDHGRHGGRTLLADGTSSTPIVGLPLDGGPDVAAIPDTDGGVLDGDTRWDRAVGPMQFIPSTWARWGTDGDGNGVVDPQDLDDVAVAAGRYLCADGHDLTGGAGWWAAVLSYNASTAYATDVLTTANAYAVRSRA